MHYEFKVMSELEKFVPIPKPIEMGTFN